MEEEEEAKEESLPSREIAETSEGSRGSEEGEIINCDNSRTRLHTWLKLIIIETQR